MKKDLSKKKENAQKALKALKKALDRNWKEDEELRDAVIQRFEFSLETFWNLQKAIFEDEGVSLASPKATFRQMHQAQILNKEETQYALDMVDDRNNTSHTYNQELAEDIASRIPEHYRFIEVLLNKHDLLE